MENYLSAMELFVANNNKKGIGICNNNIGNIQKARGDLKKAHESYQTAISIAQELLSSLRMYRLSLPFDYKKSSLFNSFRIFIKLNHNFFRYLLLFWQ